MNRIEKRKKFPSEPPRCRLFPMFLWKKEKEGETSSVISDHDGLKYSSRDGETISSEVVDCYPEPSKKSWEQIIEEEPLLKTKGPVLHSLPYLKDSLEIREDLVSGD